MDVLCEAVELMEQRNAFAAQMFEQSVFRYVEKDEKVVCRFHDFCRGEATFRGRHIVETTPHSCFPYLNTGRSVFHLDNFLATMLYHNRMEYRTQLRAQRLANGDVYLFCRHCNYHLYLARYEHEYVIERHHLTHRCYPLEVLWSMHSLLEMIVKRKVSDETLRRQYGVVREGNGVRCIYANFTKEACALSMRFYRGTFHISGYHTCHSNRRKQMSASRLFHRMVKQRIEPPTELRYRHPNELMMHICTIYPKGLFRKDEKNGIVAYELAYPMKHFATHVPLIGIMAGNNGRNATVMAYTIDGKNNFSPFYLVTTTGRMNWLRVGQALGHYVTRCKDVFYATEIIFYCDLAPFTHHTLSSILPITHLARFLPRCTIHLDPLTHHSDAHQCSNFFLSIDEMHQYTKYRWKLFVDDAEATLIERLSYFHFNAVKH